MANPQTAVKSEISNRFIHDFEVQSKFLAALVEPKNGRFDQETLRNGLGILVMTLSCVRRFDPAFAQDERFIKLTTAIKTLEDHLPIESSVILKRAANLASVIINGPKDNKQ